VIQLIGILLGVSDTLCDAPILQAKSRYWAYHLFPLGMHSASKGTPLVCIL